jgi:hypothetical protein
MRIRAITLVVSLFVCLSMRAQSGHWEGVIHSTEMNFNIEVDIAGDLTGTFTNSAMNVRGLPLSDIHADGQNVTFALKVNGGGVFHGTLSADGKSISGTFTMKYNGSDLELPFELTRKGDAKIEAAPKSAAITKALEGRWSGTIQVGGESREIGLVLANHADGTSTGVIRSSEGMEIPIASIVQKGASITLDVKNVGGTYAGTLKDNAIEGTWTQGNFSAPLTFHRTLDPIDRWAAAVGGREKIAALKSIYREATIDVMGHSGTIHVWHTMDGKYRKEEQVANFSTIETFDGTNGSMQQGDGAPRAMNASEAAVAKSKAFANANAMFFAFFPDKRRGTVSYDGDVIVLHPEGGVEWRVTLDPQTSLPKTMTHIENGRLVTVTFVAYETIDGITIEKEIQRGPVGAVIRFTKTVFDAAMP